MIATVVAALGFGLDYTGGSISGSSSHWGLTALIAVGVAFMITIVREIDLLIQPRPKVEFYEISVASGLVKLIGDLPKHLVPGCYTRLVFNNKVNSPSEQGSTAKGVSAEIIVFATNGSKIDAWDGRWAEANLPNSYEDIIIKNRRDIHPNDKAILDVGYRVKGQINFQGHDNRHDSYQQKMRISIQPNPYYLQVKLRFDNMKEKEY